MDAYDLSKIVVAPNVDGRVGVWDASTSFAAPVPLSERQLVRLVWQLAELTGSVRVFATNEQCQAWLAAQDDDGEEVPY